VNISFCLRLVWAVVSIALAALSFSGCQTSSPRGPGATAQHFTPGTLAGDQRLQNLALTLGEQQSADAAAQAFASASRNKGGKGKLSKEEKIAREALAEILTKEGVPFIRVPAHSVKKYTFSTYCLDQNLAGPKAGEKFRLVPTDTVIPPQFSKTYQGLLKIAAQNGNTHSGSVQGILWKLRHLSSDPIDKSRGAISFSPQEQQILRLADPNALTAVNSLLAVSVEETAIKLFSEIARSQIGRINMPGNMNGIAQSLFDPVSLQALARGDYEQVARIVNQKTVPVPIVPNNSEFTSLAPAVTARAVSQGGYSGLSIDVANADDGDVFFLPSSCVCQSTRPVQRLALQPPLQAFQASRAVYPFSPVAEAVRGDVVVGSDSFSNYDPRFFRKTAAPAMAVPAPVTPPSVPNIPPYQIPTPANDNIPKSSPIANRLARLGFAHAAASLAERTIALDTILALCTAQSKNASARDACISGAKDNLFNSTLDKSLAGCYDQASNQEDKDCFDATTSIEQLRIKYNNNKQHLQPKDLDAARRELRGEVVAVKKDGSPYNHIHEVCDSQTSLLNIINSLKSILSNPRLCDKSKRDAEELLTYVSSQLDFTRNFVPLGACGNGAQ
jgi:hypothetical protein